MKVYTGCAHCDKAMTADISHKEVGVEPGKLRVAAKIKCERCGGITDLLVTTLPEGETP